MKMMMKVRKNMNKLCLINKIILSHNNIILGMMITNFIKSFYNIFIKNIVLYHEPFDISLVFDKNEIKFIKPNIFEDYKDHYYFYKLYSIKHINNKYLNMGHRFHTRKITNNTKIDFNKDLDIAFPPSDITNIIVSLKTKYGYSINVSFNNDLFINDILRHSTNKSNLDILIYYYLHFYLGYNDIIIDKTLIYIDDKEYKIDASKTLEEIYNDIECD